MQINDRYWCSPPEPHSECNIRCDKLTDDNLRDDIECVRKILSIHGLDAWVGWRRKCQGDNHIGHKYLQRCDLNMTCDDENEADNDIPKVKPQNLAVAKSNQQAGPFSVVDYIWKVNSNVEAAKPRSYNYFLLIF